MKETSVVLENEIMSLYLPECDGLIDCVAKVFRLDETEKNRIYDSRTARIIASIPFVSGAWNYLKIKRELTYKLNAFSNLLLDSCYYVNKGKLW